MNKIDMGEIIPITVSNGICGHIFHNSAEDRKHHGVIWLFYMKDVGQTLDWLLFPNLKEQIHLTSFSKMRVDLAVQVCYYIDTSIYKYTVL